MTHRTSQIMPESRYGRSIQVDAAGLTPLQVSRLAATYLWFEGFFAEAAMGADRLPRALRNRRGFGGVGTPAVNVGLAAVLAAGKGAATMLDVVSAFQRSHDVNLNLHGLFGPYPVIEFRELFPAGADQALIAGWVGLTTAFVDQAGRCRPRPRKGDREWTPGEEMALLFSMIRVEDEVRHVFTERLRRERPVALGQPQTLVGFLRALGGLRDQGSELAARDLGRRFPGLVSAKGLPMDRAREAAAEAGYLGALTERAIAETLPDDLIEAIERHPVYSVRDEGIVAELEARAAKRESAAAMTDAQTAIERYVEKNGAFADDAWKHRAAALVAAGEPVDEAMAESFVAAEAEAEAGAEGLPQLLIAGVKPVKARERLQLRADAPLRGGAAPITTGLFGGGLPPDLFADCPF